HDTLGPQALDQVSLVRTRESCLINGAYRGPIPGVLATDDRFVRWKHASDFSVTCPCSRHPAEVAAHHGARITRHSKRGASERPRLGFRVRRIVALAVPPEDSIEHVVRRF